jgi:hypothetical protein
MLSSPEFSFIRFANPDDCCCGIVLPAATVSDISFYVYADFRFRVGVKAEKTGVITLDSLIYADFGDWVDLSLDDKDLNNVFQCNECFRIVIADEGGIVQTASNLLQYTCDTAYSSVIKYRLDEAGFGWDCPTGWNSVRLPVYLTNPQFPQEQEVYKRKNGSRKVLFAEISKDYTLLTDYLHEEWHQKLVIALSHDEVYIDSKLLTKSEDYSIDWESVQADTCGRLAPASCRMVENITAINSNCGDCSNVPEYCTAEWSGFICQKLVGEDFIPISTANDLLGVNSIANPDKLPYVLVNDIAIPEGTSAGIHNFSGVLYGQGYAIGGTFPGMFLGFSGQIRDVAFTDVNMDMLSGDSQSPGLLFNCRITGVLPDGAAIAQYCTLEQCAVNVSTSLLGSVYPGGVLSYCTLNDCRINAVLTRDNGKEYVLYSSLSDCTATRCIFSIQSIMTGGGLLYGITFNPLSGDGKPFNLQLSHTRKFLRDFYMETGFDTPIALLQGDTMQVRLDLLNPNNEPVTGGLNLHPIESYFEFETDSGQIIALNWDGFMLWQAMADADVNIVSLRARMTADLQVDTDVARLDMTLTLGASEWRPENSGILTGPLHIGAGSAYSSITDSVMVDSSLPEDPFTARIANAANTHQNRNNYAEQQAYGYQDDGNIEYEGLTIPGTQAKQQSFYEGLGYDFNGSTQQDSRPVWGMDAAGYPAVVHPHREFIAAENTGDALAKTLTYIRYKNGNPVVTVVKSMLTDVEPVLDESAYAQLTNAQAQVRAAALLDTISKCDNFELLNEAVAEDSPGCLPPETYIDFGGTNSVQYDCTAGTSQLSVNSSSAWTMADTLPDWLTLDTVSGPAGQSPVNFTAAANDTGADRSVSLSFTNASGDTAVLYVLQRACGAGPLSVRFVLPDGIDKSRVMVGFTEIAASNGMIVPVEPPVQIQMLDYHTPEGEPHQGKMYAETAAGWTVNGNCTDILELGAFEGTTTTLSINILRDNDECPPGN